MSAKIYRSRPEVQAEDVGPIINHIATKLYQQVGEQWQPTEEFPPDGVTQNTAKEISSALDDELRDWEKSAFAGSQTQLMLDCSNAQNNHDRPITISASAAIREGLRSGIAVPVKALHKKLKLDKDYSSVDYRWLDSIDHRVITGFLKSKNFQAELLLLSHAPNDTYGLMSTSPDASSLFYRRTNPGYENGRLGMAFINEIRDLRSKSNAKELDSSPPSMGCPVRLATYPKLGSIAMTYSEEFGIEPEVLERSRKSAIVVGSELVADCIEAHYEAYPAQVKTSIPPLIRELVRTSLF